MQKSCLPEEKSLYLKQIIAVFVDRCQRNILCPYFEGIAVYSKSEIACQRNEKHIFPVAVVFLQELFYVLRFVLETFHLKSGQPAMQQEGRKLGDNAETGRIAVGTDQLFIIFQQISRVVQFHLWNHLSITSRGSSVNVRSYVQDNRVVCRIKMMIVAKPVGSLLVYFNVSHPGYIVYLDFGIEKIRSGVHVCQSRVNDFNRLSVGSLQRFQCEKLVFPHIVQEFFHVNEV